jgi:UDPglucose 6-dehydrogenase
MNISVFGTGYVGLVTGVSFAEMGNDVVCVDVDLSKIETLKKGRSPIYEPGLEDLIGSNLKGKRLQFTTESRVAVESSEIIFIAVGTPSDTDGSADLKYVLQVAEALAQNMNGHKFVVTKSTVPVGTCFQIHEVMKRVLAQRGVSHTYDLISNPEFLREGSAIEDCLKPSRVIVGCESELAKEIMTRIYEPFLKSGNPLLFMDLLSAEMTKYAANAMLAAKISLMNEFSRVCDKVGADIESVRKGLGSDPRIGPHFIFAGVGYGGSCFPKDVKALIKAGRDHNEKLQILEAVESANQLQRSNFFQKVKTGLGGSLKGITLGLWGTAFKPGTDDIRDAPSIDLIQWLIKEGSFVNIYDPVAAQNAQKYFEGHPALKFFEDQYEALENCSCLVIVTEWKSFKEPNFLKMKTLLKKPLIFDGRNLFSLKMMKELGYTYHSIGRPLVKESI